MIIIIGILIALASWVANSVGGIVFGIVLIVIGLGTSKSNNNNNNNNNNNITQTQTVKKNNKPTEEKIKEIEEQFKNNELVKLLCDKLTEEEFRYYDENETEINKEYNRTGIIIYKDKIKTFKKEYKYKDYKLKNLDNKKMNDLALYFQIFLDKTYSKRGEIIHKVKIINEYYGSNDSSTFYYETPGGHLGIGGGGGSDSPLITTIGYRVYISNPEEDEKRKLKEW